MKRFFANRFTLFCENKISTKHSLAPSLATHTRVGPAHHAMNAPVEILPVSPDVHTKNSFDFDTRDVHSI